MPSRQSEPSYMLSKNNIKSFSLPLASANGIKENKKDWL
jgi:hypothetical protein